MEVILSTRSLHLLAEYKGTRLTAIEIVRNRATMREYSRLQSPGNHKASMWQLTLQLQLQQVVLQRSVTDTL